MRARKRIGTIVLVVAPDAGVAAWAAESIDLGLGRGHVEPLELGPAVVPEITDPADAEKETELAVLSAVAHGNGPRAGRGGVPRIESRGAARPAPRAAGRGGGARKKRELRRDSKRRARRGRGCTGDPSGLRRSQRMATKDTHGGAQEGREGRAGRGPV
ncbi:hypothetical protein [Sorangium cellulosum]|uniref:hypothetical protein n=1 Tax=Sorangium cellulosum TaxID=56 RepID=UPI001F5D7F49|nr:hypothetical protein [Sorangium cellulosum]